MTKKYKFLHTTNPENPDDIDAIHEYYLNLIAHMPNNVYWLDKNCMTQGCNENVLKFVGLEKLEDFIGITYEKMGEIAKWTTEQTQSFKKDDMEVMTTGKPKVNVEEPIFYDHHGNPVHYLSTRMPLFDKNGDVMGVVGISVDITELKKSQEREKILLIESVEAKSKAEAEQQLRQSVMILTGSIAHDLRTPLVSIELNGDLLIKHMKVILESYYKAIEAGLMNRSELPPPRVLEHFTKIGEHIKNTVRDLQNFIDTTLKTLSKTVTHNLDTSDLSICEMWHCLHNVLFRYPFVDNEQTLIFWDKKNFKFKGDKLLVFRVFSNLIKNSLEQIQKNKRGEIIITTESNESYHIIRFKDTAGGAPPEIVEKMFAGFETTKEKGTGIGLSFSKMVMESFGGSMTCHSEYGEYIEFVLSFPKLTEE